MSQYYLKEAVQATWSGEFHGWRALADFTKAPMNGLEWIPDPATNITHPGHRQSRHIRNNMDALEVRVAEKYCLACGGEHLRKDCDSYPTHKNADGTVGRRVSQRNPKK
jgi:hypothetical protein